MRRFSKRKWLRLIDQLWAEAEYFDPGHPWDTPFTSYRQTDAQNRRQENRSADFQCIAARASYLHDALTTLRR